MRETSPFDIGDCIASIPATFDAVFTSEVTELFAGECWMFDGDLFLTKQNNFHVRSMSVTERMSRKGLGLVTSPKLDLNHYRRCGCRGIDFKRVAFRVRQFDGITVGLDLADVSRVEGEFTELSDGEGPAEFVLFDGERGGLRRLLRGFGFFDDDFGVDEAEQLNRVIRGIEVQTVTNGDVLTLFGVVIVLFADFVCGKGFLQGGHDFGGGLFLQLRPRFGVLRHEDFQLRHGTFNGIVVVETEVDDVAGEVARSLGEIGEGSELAVGEGLDGLGDFSDFVFHNFVIDLRSMLMLTDNQRISAI